jgi:hypothetical protein
MVYMNVCFNVQKKFVGKLPLNLPEGIDPKRFAMDFAREHARQYGVSAYSNIKSGYEFWTLNMDIDEDDTAAAITDIITVINDAMTKIQSFKAGGARGVRDARDARGDRDARTEDGGDGAGAGDDDDVRGARSARGARGAREIKQCTFDGYCTKAECKFKHFFVNVPKKCGFDGSTDGCNNPTCKFAHPSKDEVVYDESNRVLVNPNDAPP